MIVSCPSCGARYRVEAVPSTDRGRCSSCGSVVPFVAAPRPYVLMPATAGATPWAAERGASPVRATVSAPTTQAASPPAYDPWAEPEAHLAPAEEVPQRILESEGGRAGSPLLPALLAVVGALVGYWAGTQGFLGGLPVVSVAGPAGLAVLGASVGLLAGWAGDRWTAGR